MAKLYMHGSDKARPAAYTRMLKEAGFSALVDAEPSPKLIEAAAASGLLLYACVGAFWLKDDYNDSAHFCVDVNGDTRSWFTSGCPNDPALRGARLNEIRKWAKTDGIAGVLLDGGRYASPASQEGIDSFFTCFCPYCRAEMARLGYDPLLILTAAKTLKETGDLSADSLDAFFAFREASMNCYYREYKAAVKEAKPSAQAGAYVFADSLAYFTGQRAESIGKLDIIAPMIYRHYPHEHGPATLNHEWAAVMKLSPEDARRIAGRYGVTLPTDDPDALLADGFPPEAIGNEVRLSKARFETARLWPIIELDDERLQDSLLAALRGGADSVGFFAWSNELSGRLIEVRRAIDKLAGGRYTE